MAKGLTGHEKQALLEWARHSVHNALSPESTKQAVPELPIFQDRRGAFVTLKRGGRLRGCIGTFRPSGPLYETISDMALAAALHDPRFPAVTLEELDRLEFEISVLSPLKKVDDVSKIEVGRHGLFVSHGMNSGVLLPQVAVEYGWDRERFLEETCAKAGLHAAAWKDGAEIETFEAEVFSESQERS